MLTNCFIVIQDAIRYENGREVAGSAIIVEWAKGAPRRPGAGGGGGDGGGRGGRGDVRESRGRVSNVCMVQCSSPTVTI